MESVIKHTNSDVPILGEKEAWALLDQQTRALMHMNAEEFAQRLKAGEFDAVPDDLEHSDLHHLILLFTGGR